MADSRKVAQAEFDSWIQATEAIKVLSPLGHLKFQTLVSRLASGLARSAAENYAVNAQDFAGLTTIPQSLWKLREDSGFVDTDAVWATNEFSIWTSISSHRDAKHRFFGVRFDPAEISKMLPNAHGVHIPPAYPPPMLDPWPEPAGTPDGVGKKGPPISQAALEAWFKAYKAAFTGAEDTEAKAIESAKGCFPGKSFSREAVRTLRGTQKRGPKSKSAE